MAITKVLEATLQVEVRVRGYMPAFAVPEGD